MSELFVVTMYKDFEEMASRIVDALRPVDETVERIQKGVKAISWQVDTLILGDSKGVMRMSALRHSMDGQFWSIYLIDGGISTKIGDVYGDVASVVTFMLITVKMNVLA